jgi:hypothetical protein
MFFKVYLLLNYLESNKRYYASFFIINFCCLKFNFKLLTNKKNYHFLKKELKKC